MARRRFTVDRYQAGISLWPLVALTPTADGFLSALLGAREVAAAPRTGTHQPLRCAWRGRRPGAKE